MFSTSWGSSNISPLGNAVLGLLMTRGDGLGVGVGDMLGVGVGDMLTAGRGGKWFKTASANPA